MLIEKRFLYEIHQNILLLLGPLLHITREEERISNFGNF